MQLFIFGLLVAVPVLAVCAVLIARKFSKGLDSVDFAGAGKNYDY